MLKPFCVRADLSLEQSSRFLTRGGTALVSSTFSETSSVFPEAHTSMNSAEVRPGLYFTLIGLFLQQLAPFYLFRSDELYYTVTLFMFLLLSRLNRA